MSFGVRVRIKGERACFTRPEMKAERVSYPAITPSAARGILEAVHWKPAIRWVIDRIVVLNPIRFEGMRRNEIDIKASAQTAQEAMGGKGRVELLIEDKRQQRVTLMLRDVDYLVDAHFEMTDRAGVDDNPAKHHEILVRRLRKGQCFHQPCLGCREFPAEVSLLEEGADVPMPHASFQGPPQDLGWMLHDIDFAHGRQPRFFRAMMENGVIDVPAFPAAITVAS